MKTSFTLAILGLAGIAVAEPPRAAFSRQAESHQLLASRSISSDAASFANGTYDFLIVGAGTAGLTLAARLSENGKYTVGVLEAGISGFNVSIIDTPGAYGADVGTIFDCELLFLSHLCELYSFEELRELHDRRWYWKRV